MAVVAHVYNTSHIVMVWELNVACNGHFLEIFQPLENVTFITPSQRPLFKQHALAYDGPSHGNFLQFFTRFKLETLFPTINSRLELEKRQYRLFKPVSLVINEVFQFVKRHHICGCIGLHVRQTDLADYLKSLKKINSSSLTPYFEFIDSHSATNVSSTLDSHSRHPCVYLMTDNPTTQQTFLKRYGSSRLLVYKRISSTPEEGSIRFTSLFHTLVDVLITAFTYDFKPSFYSSMSDLVRTFNVTFVRDRHHTFYAACRHRHKPLNSIDYNIHS